MKTSRLAFLLLASAMVTTSLAQTHPFLIVKQSDYATLQARAANSPWKEMKASAINDANNNSYSTSLQGRDKTSVMLKVVSSCALAYILDPANRTTYVSKLNHALSNWDDVHSTHDDWSDRWSYNVPAGTAFFNSVLALDIVYSDLTASQRSNIESKMQVVADWFRTDPAGSGWQPNPQGVAGVWALYMGQDSVFQEQKDEYYEQLMKHFTEDGIFREGSGYGHARFGGGRDAKIHFLDVLEHTGTDQRYYNSTKLQLMYEWLYGYADSPFNRHIPFCDTDPTESGARTGSAICRASRFSSHAARLAAWRNNGSNFPGRLLHYVLMDAALPSPVKPQSRIFWEGYAAFMETDPVDRSLMGALWCCTTSGWHTHKEVNAMYLAAYGEHVLVNAGYAGASANALGSSWSYINSTGRSGNTVCIQLYDHQYKHGDGIAEGFVGGELEYASASSGSATPYGHHQRNFCMVHPQDGANGYFVVFDEVQVQQATMPIYMMLHPHADNLSTIATGTEFRSKIGPRTYSGHDVYLSIFHATPPATVQIDTGVIAAFGNRSFMGKYLFNTFVADADLQKQMVTVLFPHDATHAKATMSRISGAGFTGAKVDLGNNIADVALESRGESEIGYDNVFVQARAALWRKSNGTVSFYFARKAKSWTGGSTAGFSSDSAVTLYVKGGTGQIVSPGAAVTFRYPGVAGVRLNGTAWAAKIAGSANSITVDIPQGTYSLELLDAGSIKPVTLPMQSALRLSCAHSGKTVFFSVSLKEDGPFVLRLHDIKGQKVWEHHGRGGHAMFRQVEWVPTGVPKGMLTATLLQDQATISTKFTLAP